MNPYFQLSWGETFGFINFHSRLNFEEIHLSVFFILDGEETTSPFVIIKSSRCLFVSMRFRDKCYNFRILIGLSGYSLFISLILWYVGDFSDESFLANFIPFYESTTIYDWLGSKVYTDQKDPYVPVCFAVDLYIWHEKWTTPMNKRITKRPERFFI